MEGPGGVRISVGPRWVSDIQQYVTLVAGKAMYVTFRINQSLIGFVCIYAPTEARSRSRFWSTVLLMLCLLWILGLLEETLIILRLWMIGVKTLLMFLL